MNSEPLVKRVKDGAGKLHEMESYDNLYWSRCRKHDDPITRAMRGLPGANNLPCQTGQGWPYERLFRIGWPIWLANFDYRTLSQMVETPSEVLAHIVRWNEAVNNAYLAEAMCRRRDTSAELLGFIGEKFPQLKARIQLHPNYVGAVSVKGLSLSQMDDLERKQALLTLDLSRMKVEELTPYLGGEDLGFRWEMAQNPTLPPAIMQQLVDKGVCYSELVGNPGAPTEILDEIFNRTTKTYLLQAIAEHNHASVPCLAQLTQHKSKPIAEAAGCNLAKATRQTPFVPTAEIESEEVGLSV